MNSTTIVYTTILDIVNSQGQDMSMRTPPETAWSGKNIPTSRDRYFNRFNPRRLYFNRSDWCIVSQFHGLSMVFRSASLLLERFVLHMKVRKGMSRVGTEANDAEEIAADRADIASDIAETAERLIRAGFVAGTKHWS